MRFVISILMFATLMALGCSSTGNRRDPRDARENPDSQPRGNPDWWNDAEGPGTSNKNRREPDRLSSDRDVIIAGIVYDGRTDRALNGLTYIHIREAGEAATTGKLGVETDEYGSFLISGLKPGLTYILSTAREVDGRKMGAELHVRPPAGNVRVTLRENNTSAVNPPPAPVVGMGPFEPGRSTSPSASNDRGWQPGTSPPGSTVPAGGFQPLVPTRPESIASIDGFRPPPASIRSGAKRVDDAPPQSKLPLQKLPNFALSDILGRDWELRNASGRYILVDFWKEGCPPCVALIPSLKQLRSDYGASGLEILAVGCEIEGAFANRARVAENYSRAKQLNYRVYLEREGKQGDVQRLFNVQWYPTLVLIDRQGEVKWRGGGTATDVRQLDGLLRTLLSRRE